ncbi:MAG TPA: carotenoid oxygenase family protein, partial [Acidimicrobiales bacterium]|nr:carotenoid oxygenase family protein [Acidimicrobiales bacterium]
MSTALFHHAGNFRPVTDELTTFDLPITGQLPAELHGTFIRNGPNPIGAATPHWFMGDGMVHGVRIEDGSARWYRNRTVRTTRLAGAPPIRPDGSRDLTAGQANTNVIRHANRILALEESSLPYELTAELDTVGPFDFDGALTRPMTAHPKICPRTGELHLIGYDFAPPYLTYHVADAHGRLIFSRDIDIPAPVMMHDFCLTEHYVVFLDLPAVFDLDLALHGTMPFRFEPHHGARLGLLRRDHPRSVVTWIDIEPCYV